jgi:simple sugar transport system ATP-binding protein
VRPDAGTVRVGDVRGPFPGPREAIAAGVGMVHQHFMLVGPMTVAENVFLGREPVDRGLLRWDSAMRRLETIAGEHGLEIDPAARVETLGVGRQQRVEILKLLVRGARVLVLDEPTAVLTPDECEGLFGVLRRLRGGGASIVLITHRLDEVVRVADRVTVMRGGRTLATHDVGSVTTAALAEEMVGREVPLPTRRARTARAGPQALVLEGVGARGEDGHEALTGISLRIAPGEILGIAGVEGNGQTELTELVAGLRRPHSGSIRLSGEDVTRLGRAERLRRGVAFVPEDRLDRGLVRDFSLEENLVLGRHRIAPIARRGMLDRGEIRRSARERLTELDVRPPDPTARAATLSGGNQQKVVMARELAGAPRLIVAAQPTRGIDVGAIVEVHRRILDAAAAGGAGVLLVSAELEELLALADRIAVLYRGRIVGECDREDATPAKLGRWMLRGRTDDGPGGEEASP